MVTVTINKSPASQQTPSQSSNSFVQRQIDATITLASAPGTGQPNVFAGTNSSTLRLSGLWASAHIKNSGGIAGSAAHIAIWGMTPSQMNQLSTLGMIYNLVPRNTITISAGDRKSGLSPVFSGTIIDAYADYSSQPDVPFHFACQSGLGVATAPATPTSAPGPSDVASIMAGLARQMNLGFENNGVSVQLPPMYLSGSLLTQVRTVAEAANIYAYIDGAQIGAQGSAPGEASPSGVLAIWPKNGFRKGSATIPVISAATGMVSYPSFTPQGIVVKFLYNPKVSFGSRIRVTSSLPTLKPQKGGSSGGTSGIAPTSTIWTVLKLDHALETVPNGDWLSTAYAYNAAGVQAEVIPPQ